MIGTSRSTSPITPTVSAPSPLEMVTFLAQPGVGVVTYTSGASIVYVHKAQFYGDTFADALAKAIRGHARG